MKIEAIQVLSIGVKLQDVKTGELLAHSSRTTIPIGNPSDPKWAEEMARLIVTMLPMLYSQATSPIAAIDPKARLSSVDLLEKLAKKLRAEGDKAPQVFLRSDSRFEETRILVDKEGK